MKNLDELEQKLDYRFARRKFLIQALTHSSFAHENNLGPMEDNERMEFLGDSILGFLVSEALCEARPNLSEGQLSKLKGFLVSSANLVQCAEQIHLGRYLRLGKGEEKTGGRGKQALLVDAFEALIAAIYLDAGVERVKDIILRFFTLQISDISDAGAHVPDFKSALQEDLQARGQNTADYTLIEALGPDHQKLFTVDVVIDGVAVARGRGLTKKAAEQAAAMQAMNLLKKDGAS
jgi:ribonuclease-3